MFENLDRTNIDEYLKKAQDIIYIQKNDIVKALNTFSNVESNSHIVLLKVEKKFTITYVSHNCLTLFEVMQEDDLVNKRINEFMPDNIAKVHDTFLNEYLAKPVKNVLKDNYFEVPVITANLNLNEVLLGRLLDYSDMQNLFICGMLIQKNQKF